MAAVSKRDSDLSATREERAKNAQSIHDIPLAEFPDAEARAELIWRALRGEDVTAYRPAASPTYVVWVRPPDPALDGRFEPMEWAERWRAAGMPLARQEKQRSNEGGAA